MESIGLCSHYSRQGDWAFDFAFRLASEKDIQLNIFHWLESPFRFRREIVYADNKKQEVVRVTDELKAKKELELREYYEAKLGDFVKVGFRLCEGNEGAELARCLRRREYDVLVLGYVDQGADFGGQVIERFASHFKVPVVMVGPDKPNSYHLNKRGVDIVGQLGLKENEWSLIEE
ncbi:MAG: universal stress protein [Thermodesulfobacteriota bacterium]|nr:universal stress protein [Thermodesulfobacteriota bacterium]